MAKFFKRYRRRYTKRNSERHVRAGAVNAPVAGTTYTGYVYTSQQAETVKGIKLDMGMLTSAASTSNGAVIAYAIVVVREGYNANSLTYPAIAVDMYNPTMDVLMSGVLTDNQIEDHKYNGVGRKMKHGDRLCLLVLGTVANLDCAFELSFSVLT